MNEIISTSTAGIKEVKDVQRRPPLIRRDEVESPTLPLPPPRDRATVEAFLSWVAGVPRESAFKVREAIAAFQNKGAVAAVLNEHLFHFPCLDTTRHLLLLSAIGEVADLSSIDVLYKFVLLSDNQIFHQKVAEGKTCTFSTIGMLQANGSRGTGVTARTAVQQQRQRLHRSPSAANTKHAVVFASTCVSAAVTGVC